MKNILLACISLLLLVSCKKKVDELPPATQTGANTFGARVDGEMWIPKGFGPFPANDLLEARQYADGDIIINARNFSSSPNESEFQILIKGVTTTGVYPLNTTITHPSGAASYAYFVRRNLTPLNEWVTSSSSSGSVTITRIDTVNRVVSGTFQFNMLNLYNTPQPLSVTDGRFDLKIQ